MPRYRSWTYPDLRADIAELLFQNDKKLVVVGVIGKSKNADCNKMPAFDVLDRAPEMLEDEPKDGHIKFYYNPLEPLLLLHFETTHDVYCMRKHWEKEIKNGGASADNFHTFQQRMRSRFARMLLFATQVCHIVVFVELNVSFDASLLPLFKALKIIRDKHILKFLPKLLKNSNIGTLLGKSVRLCSPRFLFLFEKYPDGYETTDEDISKLEFEVEDNIYKMLRNEFIITNNSALSLFSIPSNKRFVFYNTDKKLREDPLQKSVKLLDTLLENSNFKMADDDLEDFCPYRGFGKPLAHCKREQLNGEKSEQGSMKKRNFMNLLKDHVEEAIQCGFDDNLTKFKGRSHFVILNATVWFEMFQLLHKIFIENPDNTHFEANDLEYKAYLESFDRILNSDNEFFTVCCDIGLQKSLTMYKNPTLTHYSAAVHKKLVTDSVKLFLKYARGPNKDYNEAQLREMCEQCWKNGKQQCEFFSLRGNPCILPQHLVKDVTEHTSGHIFVSACNCGRTQGRREDPYTIRHANYEFYEYMGSNCNLCARVKKVNFAVFQPSINDYRAAEFETAFPKLSLYDDSMRRPIGSGESPSQPLTASQGMYTNLSLALTDNLCDKIIVRAPNSSNDEDEDDVGSLNELVLQVKDKDCQQSSDKEEQARNIYRQPSTTEYLPGMVHTATPLGLLPQFPSWSLVCVGPSSLYSHNTGLLEHFQGGFLSGANFLLPWDVHVRLEHPSSWAAAYEKTRYRKMGEAFVLKIFVGCEYECPRGHRFMMSAPDKVLRGMSSKLRDSGSKIVYNNMPLYFPCPWLSQKSDVAQLMRVHVVTPKAPVNVILDPKVRTGVGREYTFTLGLPAPPKLTQSAYWILRLPYIYQGDECPIPPPTEINAGNAINYGCLLAGMFGVSEIEIDD